MHTIRNLSVAACLLVLVYVNLLLRQFSPPSSFVAHFLLNLTGLVFLVGIFVISRTTSQEIDILSNFSQIMKVPEKKFEIENVFNRLLKITSKLLRSDHLLLQIYNGKNRPYLPRLIWGDFSLILDKKVFDDVSTGKTILKNNLQPSSYPKITQVGYRSLLATPLMEEEKIIGLLSVFSKKKRGFNWVDLNLIEMVTGQVSSIVETAFLLEKIRILSITDSLTNLYNFRHFQEVLKKAIKEARDARSSLPLAICDIDYFKNYNDRLGHSAGNEVLHQIAQIMVQMTKDLAIVSRYGGEEFVILFPNLKKEMSLLLCQDLREKVEKYNFPGQELQPNGNLTLSIGLASYPEDSSEAEELIKKADSALYQAKKRGRNLVIAA